MHVEDARWSAQGGYEGLKTIARDMGSEVMGTLDEHSRPVASWDEELGFAGPIAGRDENGG